MVDARSRYLKKMHTPTPFSQGPEMQNYTQMMNLQNQASNFAPNDPRIQELKDRRRTYNRFDKYKIGDKFNVAPLDVQKDFSNRSNNFRNAAPNVYGKMYPLQDMAMRYGQSGGLLGLMAKEMFGKVSDFGKSMVNREGIAGAADTDEGEMEDYAAKTFGMGAPIDRHPGSTPIIEDPMEQSEVIYKPHGPIYYGRAEGLDFDEDPNQPYVAPDDYVDRFMPIERDSDREDFIRRQNEITPAEPLPIGSPDPHGDFPVTYPQDRPINTDMSKNKAYQDLNQAEIDYLMSRTDEIADEDMNIPPPIVPFDDTNREQAIANQYATNFIGPRDDPHRRPDMYDVAGPGINRGLIPYPGYSNDEVMELYGRGEMPQPYEYDFSDFFRNMREGYGEAAEYNLKEKKLQDALAADQGRSLMTIPSDFDSNRKEFTDTEDYYDWIRQMQKYGYR